MLSLLMPFRDDDGTRTVVAEWIQARWRHYFPEAELIIESDDGGTPFSKTIAVNRAAARATGDVLAILDADTWVRVERVKKVVAAIESGEVPWAMPCSRAYRLTRLFTSRLLRMPPEGTFPIVKTRTDCEEIVGAVGFMHIFPRGAWEAVGGMDPRFRGWGGEDNAITWAMDTMWGQHVQFPSTALHLWHDRPRLDGKRIWVGQTDRNRPLISRYRRALGRPDRMKVLVDEVRTLNSGCETP